MKCLLHNYFAFLSFVLTMQPPVVRMFQLWSMSTLNWTNGTLITSISVKTESCHSGEKFLPMNNIICVNSLIRSYVLSAYRPDY